MFSCERREIFRNNFLTEHLRVAPSTLNNLRGGKVSRNNTTFFSDNVIYYFTIEP